MLLKTQGFCIESAQSCWTKRPAYLEQQQKVHNDTVVKMKLIFSCFLARLLYSEQDSRLLLIHVYYMCNLLVEYMHTRIEPNLLSTVSIKLPLPQVLLSQCSCVERKRPQNSFLHRFHNTLCSGYKLSFIPTKCFIRKKLTLF